MGKNKHVMPTDDASVEEIQLLNAKEICEVSGGAGNGKATINPIGQSIGKPPLVNKKAFFS